MAGTKTSVWLGEEQYAQWKASGDSLTEIVKRGLAAPKAETEKAATPAEVREIVVEAIAAVLERLDAKPDTSDIRHMIRTELERVAGQPHV